MAESPVFDPSNPNFATAFDSLQLPNDDFSLDFTLSDGLLADLGFDGDVDFSLDDFLSLPVDDASPSPDHANSNSATIQVSGLPSLYCGGQRSDPVGAVDLPLLDYSSGSASGDQRGFDDVATFFNSSGLPGTPDRDASGSISGGSTRCSDAATVLNSPSPDSGSCSQEFSCSVSGAQCADVSRFLNSPSPDSGSFDQECSGSASGGQCGDDSRVFNTASPGSDGEFSGSASSSLVSNTIPPPPVITDPKVESEEGNKGSLLKRKKGNDEGSTEPRSSKFHKLIPTDQGNGDEKRQTRLMRNRESAQLSRQRKKHYVEELEEKVKAMHSTIAELNNKVSFIMAENASLRQQLGGGGVCAQPPPGMCPPPAMVPMHFPWVPCSSYALKLQGSQVPLIPIPRLKPQQPISVSKSKKSDSKKAETKTKKVASVSFMGLLLFLLFVGGLVPFTNNDKYAGSRNLDSGRLDFVKNGFGRGQSQGKILTVSGHLNVSDENNRFGLYNGNSGYGKGESEVMQNERVSQSPPGRFGCLHNASEPLVASLYVPRNDKLVKIDGNLIIHSVLASEKAMASSQASSGMESGKATVSSDKKAAKKNGLAIMHNLASGSAMSKSGRDMDRHSHIYRGPTNHPKALASSKQDNYKSKPKPMASDGPLEQWFQEGLAGPILSSGMCTEVFQFDVSPKPGAIVPVASVTNTSNEHHRDSANDGKKNRRILYHPAIPLSDGSGQNGTEKPPKEKSFPGNKSVSSMVVSVLVDPREGGDGDGDQRFAPKSLSRIFVVVLLDSVKYVTYSCVLPLKGSSPHLVTT